MTQGRRRLLLLGVIVVEMAIAIIVLRWALTSPGAAAPARKTETVDLLAERETRPLGVWARVDTSPALSAAIQGWVAGHPGDLAWTASATADLTIGWQKGPGAEPVAESILVPVVAFFSLRDGLTTGDLRRAWHGTDAEEASSESDSLSLIVTSRTAAALDTLLGLRGAGARVTVVPAADLVDLLWNQPGAVAIVPFDRLEPRLRPLAIDGQSALGRDLDPERYPLRARLWVTGPQSWRRSLVRDVEEQGLHTNRHPERLTVLVMTGVTALTRGVALEIEAQGDYGWPARQVADLLSSADLTHVSNEIPFAPNCQPQAETMTFCARPEYLETLRLVGADVVELTGNHNLDFGARYALFSLDLYDEAGMGTFGGGRNAIDARRPFTITHNGNRLAFLGYNQFGPEYAWATEEKPGAARFSPQILQADLAQARAQADLLFVNIQHTESYSPVPLPRQMADFRAAIEAGADAVTGSQAHQPQAIEFHGGKPIFYGLGNLFFDQTWSAATCQGLVVRHVIYDGRLIASQVIPTVMGDDCQPRLAEGEERMAILEMVFEASGWE